MARKLKPIPVFASEADERRFWETHGSTDYVDWSRAREVRLPNLTGFRAGGSRQTPVCPPEAAQDPTDPKAQ